MTVLPRRRFLEVGGLAGAFTAALPAAAFAEAQRSTAATVPAADERVVRLTGDGLGLTPAQYSHLLVRLVERSGVAPDAYILGGVVDELEAQFARLLGKERAVFLPTGTLANQLAVRLLAGGPSRAIVQAESHLYQDSGDCMQTLSNITLMPLAPGRASFTVDAVQQVLDQTAGGRVVPRVSVISIETPVRRRLGETFDGSEMARIAALAQQRGLRLHLDGARLFIEAAYAQKPITDYTRPFETVYVSLYKYFNAAAGAILAGPRDLLDGLFHTRRMFGGGLYQAWPYAVVALHHLSGFMERFRQAIRVSEEWIAGLRRHEAFTIERIPSGTNLLRLRVAAADPAAFRRRLAGNGVIVGAPQADGTFLVAVNETWNRTDAAALTGAFIRSV